MMRCCKLIVCYFGPRRTINNSPSEQGAVAFFHEVVLPAERTIQPGVAVDTYVIVNVDPSSSKVSIPSPQKIAAGTLTVLHTSNIGPFASYDLGYKLLRKRYDYFMFQEDDVVLIAEGVYQRAICQLQSDATIGFISLAPISDSHATHSGGGFGITSTTNLNLVAEVTGGKLPFMPIAAEEPLVKRYAAYEASEVQFTHAYFRINKRLEHLTGASPLAINYQTHTGQRSYSYTGGDFIYQLGRA